MFFQHSFVSEVTESALSSLNPQRRYLFWMSDYGGHTSRQGFGIAGWANDPGVPNYLAETADCRSDDEPSSHHLFNGRKSGCLFPYRGHDDNVDLVKQRRELRASKKTGDMNARAQAQARDLTFQADSFWSVAYQQEIEFAAFSIQLRCGVQQHEYAFLRNQSSHEGKAHFRRNARACRGHGLSVLNPVVDNSRVWEGFAFLYVIRYGDILHVAAQDIPYLCREQPDQTLFRGGKLRTLTPKTFAKSPSLEVPWANSPVRLLQ
jgi:hypothetical protein